jgi:drug/metabolite transporter (DMT)-like permease
MYNYKKGIFYILTAAFFFAMMSASVKYAAGISTPEKIFFRNFVGVLILLPTITKDREILKVKNWKLILLRSLFGVLGVLFNFYAISKLHLADAVILNKLSPFFVIIFCFIFLNEKITKHNVISIFIAVIGALFVIKPSFDVSMLPALSGLISAIFAGLAYTVIRKLSEYDRPQTIVFYFCLISSLSMVPIILVNGYQVPNTHQLIGLISIGISASIAQLFMTSGYRYAPASQLAIYGYANIIFSIIFGILIWNEVPDVYSIIGAITIIIAGVYNFIKSKR